MPTHAEDGTEILTEEDDGTQMLAIAELKAILRGVYALDLDFDNFNLDDLGPVFANIDLLLESAILHATISNLILDMSTEADALIVVPALYGDPAVEITKTVEGTPFIAMVELNRIIDALELLDITSFDSLAFDATTSTSSQAPKILPSSTIGKLDTLLASIILRASVTR